jgi:hypothetical protein
MELEPGPRILANTRKNDTGYQDLASGIQQLGGRDRGGLC